MQDQRAEGGDGGDRQGWSEKGRTKKAAEGATAGVGACHSRRGTMALSPLVQTWHSRPTRTRTASSTPQNRRRAQSHGGWGRCLTGSSTLRTVGRGRRLCAVFCRLLFAFFPMQRRLRLDHAQVAQSRRSSPRPSSAGRNPIRRPLRAKPAAALRRPAGAADAPAVSRPAVACLPVSNASPYSEQGPAPAVSCLRTRPHPPLRRPSGTLDRLFSATIPATLRVLQPVQELPGSGSAGNPLRS